MIPRCKVSGHIFCCSAFIHSTWRHPSTESNFRLPPPPNKKNRFIPLVLKYRMPSDFQCQKKCQKLFHSEGFSATILLLDTYSTTDAVLSYPFVHSLCASSITSMAPFSFPDTFGTVMSNLVSGSQHVPKRIQNGAACLKPRSFHSVWSNFWLYNNLLTLPA